MSGAGRLGGRGVVAAAARIPASDGGPAARQDHRLVLSSRIASVLAAQLLDMATFAIMVGRHGIIAEVNPLVAQGFEGFGMPMVVLMKIALVVLVSSIITVLSRRNTPAGGTHARGAAPDLVQVVTLVAVLAGLVGGISNVLAT
jgi:hypothetical protein